MSAAALWFLIASGLLTVTAAFLAALEAAISGLSRTRVKHLFAAGQPGAQRLGRIVGDPGRYLNTAFFLKVVSEVGAILTFALAIEEISGSPWVAALITAAVMIIISFVLWGVAPRTLGRRHPERIALLMSRPLMALAPVFAPVQQLLLWFGNAVTPGKGYREGPFSSELELRELVDLAEESQVIESDERRMIHSVFELGDTVVRTVMVPRTEMVTMAADTSLDAAIRLCLASGFSRIPVVGPGGADDIVGIAYVKDIMRRLLEGWDANQDAPVSAVMREPQWCPSSKPVTELLAEMQRLRTHVVIVVDEFGGTDGLATIEDIVEEIVGEIRDEHDVSEPAQVQVVAPGEFRVTSRLPIADLGELFGFELSDTDVDSVGGLFAKELGRVPIAGDTATVQGVKLIAERGTGRRKGVGSFLVSRASPQLANESAAPRSEVG